MNRERAIRTLVYQLLNGQLVREAYVVPVWDAKLEDAKSNLYVIIEGQSANVINKFPHQRTWQCDIALSIVSRQNDGVSRDLVDDVAEQIETIIYQSMYDGSVYDDWQFTNVVLDRTNSNAFSLGHSMSEVSKDLVFRIEASKTTQY